MVLNITSFGLDYLHEFLDPVKTSLTIAGYYIHLIWKCKIWNNPAFSVLWNYRKIIPVKTGRSTLLVRTSFWWSPGI